MGQLSYFLHGKNLYARQQKFQDFQFLGNYVDGEWHIEKLDLDDLSLAADIVRTEKGFHAKFLGCRWGEGSFLGMDGTVSPGYDRIEANLNLVDFNLQDLEKVEIFKPFFTQFSPRGSIRANRGKLTMVFDKGEWDIDLKFLASLKNFSLEDLDFQDFRQISVVYQTNRRLTIAGLKPSAHSPQEIQMGLDRVDLDLNRHELVIEGLTFHVPPTHIPLLTNFLEKKFPGAVNSSISPIIREIRPVDPLTGTVNVTLNPVRSVTEITFEDGAYRFFDQEWSLKDFQFVKVDGDITLTAQSRLFGDWVGVKTSYVGKAFPSGVLELEREDEKLNIVWKKGQDPQISIDRIEGVFAGAHIEIEREGSGLKGAALSDDFSSCFDIQPDKVVVSDLNWHWMRGEVRCPQAVISRSSSGQWEYHIPRVSGHSIQVDGLDKWHEFMDSGIVVNQLELADVHGSLFHPEIVTGRGSLSFFSPYQSDLRSFPFVKEKIQDLTVLKPVSGALEFEINSGELTLTSLSNMVDQRQMFRYCLPSTHKNVLNADGSIHLMFHLIPNHSKVRMGDLVSVVVEGTWDHPTFSLKKTKELSPQ